MSSVSPGAARGVKTRLNSQPSAGLSLNPQDLAASVAAGRQNHRGLASGKENDKRKIPPKAKRVKMASAFVVNRCSFAVYRSLLYRFPCCVGKGLEMLNGRESEAGASMGWRARKAKGAEGVVLENTPGVLPQELYLCSEADFAFQHLLSFQVFLKENLLSGRVGPTGQFHRVSRK